MKGKGAIIGFYFNLKNRIKNKNKQIGTTLSELTLPKWLSNDPEVLLIFTAQYRAFFAQ